MKAEVGAKRHQRKPNRGITKPAIRRIARRSGVKRLSGLVYDEARDITREFVSKFLRDATMYANNSKRKTVTTPDLLRAFERQGRAIYV